MSDRTDSGGVRMKSDSGAAPARTAHPRRSREDASRALVDAAAALFAERPSGNVTVREIIGLALDDPVPTRNAESAEAG